MGIHMKSTVIWALLLFVLIAVINCIIGLKACFSNAVAGAIIAGVGFYFGYEKAKEDFNR